MSTVATSTSLSRTIAEFAHSVTFDDLPPAVVETAKSLLLDTIGNGLASAQYGFADVSARAIRSLAAGLPGQVSVIGGARLPLRDAVLLNGILMHGLDFDDTHPEGVVHASASAVPTALGVGELLGVSGRDLLTAYVVGLEITARVGMAAQGAFHRFGFHPTGVAGAFGAAVIAAKLHGATVDQIVAAQGVVGSFASGSLEFLETGAWNKRAHPGWAGVSGITAAALAIEGFEAPELVYEGRYGLYASHLQGVEVDLSLVTSGLGERWETSSIAVKPYPACHFTHAFADATLELVRAHDLRSDDIASIHCLIAQGEAEVVCEPIANKLVPRNAYDAQFSLPYVVAATLERRQFTLAELDDASLHDPAILRLARRVGYAPDPASAYPKAFSGEVIVTTKDGRELRHREQINRGAGDRPLSSDDIEAKFRATAGLALDAERVEALIRSTRQLDEVADVRAYTAGLAG